ncbi:MAG: YdjY domain-containing protein [Acidobacteria bacterium]|nr:YdjY domain-containing protein [Acidobacteriota bacterium]
MTDRSIPSTSRLSRARVAKRAAFAAAGVVAAALLLLAFKRRPPAPGSVEIRPPREIEFTASVNARAFSSGWMMPGYHAIVWKGGRAAHFALLQADVTDTQILDALESLGARPGNNLTMEVWDKREDPKNPAPDTVIAGPPVEILLRLPGRAELVPFASVLSDSGARGLEMRFGGNRINIPKWKSGCVVCLYSCPGSKVGNARYTVRDYAREATRFRVREGALPADGTPVGVVFRLAQGPSHA